MRKLKRDILRMIWLGILAVFLCGCGKEEREQGLQDTLPADYQSGNAGSQMTNGRVDLPEGYALYARYEYAGDEMEMQQECLWGNILYYMVYQYDSERNQAIRQAYFQSKENKACQLTDQTVIGDGKWLESMTVGEDGSLYLLYGEGEETAPIWVLEKRDRELQVIYSVSTAEGMEDVMSVYQMEAASDGMIYALTTKGIVLYWDEEGIYQGRFLLPETIAAATTYTRNLEEYIGACYGLSNAGTSGVYAYCGGQGESGSNMIHLYPLQEWREMDEAERETAEPLQIDFTTRDDETVLAGAGVLLQIFSGYGDGLYMADVNCLWRIDLTDGSLEALLYWKDSDVDPLYVKEIQRQEDGGFLLYYTDRLEQGNYWVSLEPVPVSELPEKHELVLGVASGQWSSKSLTASIEQVVLSYNRTHPYSNITVKKYEEGSVTNFQLELLKGEGPDILLELESFFDIESLAGKGVIEDLAPYLANAEGISEEDILPGILALTAKDGKIPRIPLSFSVNVMILPESIGQDVLTPQERAEYMLGSDYVDYLVFPRDFLLQTLSGAEMDHYVNAADKSCSFDNEEFVCLLETLAKLDDVEMIRSRGERAELFRSGQLNAVVEEMSCLEDYLCIREAFSGAGEITGFPNSSGELRYPVKLYDWMGINSASKYKEEAWDFIEFCLSYMSHSDNVTDRFVVTKDKFEEQTHYDRKASHFIKSNYYNENWVNWQMIEPMTDEETELLWGISDHLYFYEDNDLLQIISEEVEMFFSGAISAQEAAERIQSRASLIVGE